MRRQLTPSQKAAIALAALKGDKTINQVASEYQVNPTQVKQWRDAAKAALPETFTDKRGKGRSGEAATATEYQVDELRRVIGVRVAELEWFKKKIHGLGL